MCLSGFGFANLDRETPAIFSVQSFYRGFGLDIAAHLDKTKTFALARLAVGNYISLFNLSKY